MSTYKVLQDIEAEDKLVGPLSFRQCVYAGAAIFGFYLCYLVTTHGGAFLLVILLPPALFCAFFAIPWQSQQSTEVWALAKIRFMFKPRKRIWDQSGVKELVTITAPKKVEVKYTDGLTQTEVSSRLKALAETIDSRGWAIKNVPMNAYNQPLFQGNNASDRLMGVDDFAREVPTYDESVTTDVLDTSNNPIAEQFDQMIHASRQAHRQQAIDSMRSPIAQPQNQPGIASVGSSAVPHWYTQQYAAAPVSGQGAVLPQITQAQPQATIMPSASTQNIAAPLGGFAPVNAQEPLPSTNNQSTTISENELLNRLHEQDYNQSLSSAHMRTIQPLGQAPVATTNTTMIPEPVVPVTRPFNPAILELANNNDLNVATIAREVNKHPQESTDQDEVVISLH